LKSSRETLQDYLSYILESEIIFLIPQFSYSLKVQEKNPKKIYCLDNGLRRTAAFLFSKALEGLRKIWFFWNSFAEVMKSTTGKIKERLISLLKKKGEHWP